MTGELQGILMIAGAMAMAGALVLKKLGISGVHEVYPGILTGLVVYAVTSRKKGMK